MNVVSLFTTSTSSAPCFSGAPAARSGEQRGGGHRGGRRGGREEGVGCGAVVAGRLGEVEAVGLHGQGTGGRSHVGAFRR